MAIDNFVYNAEHGVIICRQCESCLVAKEGSWVSHLRNRPHSMKGELLVRTLEHFHSFGNLSSVDDLRRRAADRRRLRQPCRPIDGLALYEGFICNCTKTCFFSTRRLDKIRNHMSVHGKKAKQHSDATPLWRACKLQNYFTAKPLLDYFEVDGAAPIMLQEAAPTMIEEAAPTIPQEAAPTMIEEAAPTIPQEAAPLDSSSSSSSLPTSLPTSLLTSSPSTLSSFSSSYLSLSFPTARATTVAQHARSQFFQSIKERMRHSSELSYVVQDPLRCAALRDRDPWLVTTGFALHLDGLLDAEIRSSYALPASLEGNVRLDGSSEEASDRDLRRILVAAEHTLRDAYRLCNDTSHRRKLTQQRAITLNQLRLVDARDLGATRGVPFRASKHSNTLNVYFHLTKQLLTYYYRVVYRPAGHFTSNTEGHPLPHDEIQPTSEQSQAMDTIIAVLRRQDALNNVMIIDDDDDPAATAELDGQLRKAIRDLLVSLICCWVGDTPFESALLSFCAMRSLTLAQPIDGSFNARGLCKWREPKNYLGDLSALIWTSQLMLFDSVCFACKDNRQQILARLQDTCRAYCHDMAESPLGQMLQWTSYLFAAFMDTMVKTQACWSIDGLTVQYKGTELHLDHISHLVVSEYKVASRILYDDLLLGIMADMPHIEPWRLQDYLDQAEQGASSRTDARQADLLAETQLAILNKIEASPELQRTFVRQLDLRRPAFCFCPNAIALYEKRIQDFLERLLVMIHISSGPPLRASELLSVIVSDTDDRRRSVVVREKSVLLRVLDHKSLDLTGSEKDKLRFLPSEIGSLLLTFLAFVQPLRRVFLRQIKPEARLSPYLWSKLDGSVWDDGRVSACLSRACAQAAVPAFKAAWWRQVAASIIKEKFSQQQRAHFDLDDVEASEEIEDEEDLAYLAGMSNHSVSTPNHAYAGRTYLTASSLIHHAYHASDSWRTLLNIDAKLLAERLGPGSCAAARRVAQPA